MQREIGLINSNQLIRFNFVCVNTRLCSRASSVNLASRDSKCTCTPHWGICQGCDTQLTAPRTAVLGYATLTIPWPRIENFHVTSRVTCFCFVYAALNGRGKKTHIGSQPLCEGLKTVSHLTRIDNGKCPRRNILIRLDVRMSNQTKYIRL